jgi:16S rRNA (cytosine967-C5)-methyltransferase
MGLKPSVSAAHTRLAAAQLLLRVLEQRRTLDEAMDETSSFRRLEGPDRGFARAIASAALRQLGRIDLALDPLMSRPMEAASPPIRALIRAGAAQLWCLDTPPHAAVDATVEAARLWPEARSGGGFVNAVLRRASEAGGALLHTPALSAWPLWLATEMIGAFGTGRAEALAGAQLSEPRLHLTARADAAALAKRMGTEMLPCGSVLAPPGAVDGLPGYAEGEWWVQDRAAALPARLLDFKPGDRVLDLCAAPGGKTLQLAARGGRVTAVDRSASRLQRLRENLARTRLDAEIIAADLLVWRPEAPCDFILLDAPCSAHGTLRRHPEGAWIKPETDTAYFASVQAALLERALGWLSPRGQLVYCVCSPLGAEGSRQVDTVVAAGLARREPPDAAVLTGFEGGLTDKGDVLTGGLPGEASDAFFISRLTRNVS